MPESRKCENCGNTKPRRFRAIRQARSQTAYWACGVKCAAVVKAAMERAVTVCAQCQGYGQLQCPDETCPDPAHACPQCAATGVVERFTPPTRGPNTPPPEEERH